MVRTQLYLPDDLYKALKKKAKTKGMSFAGFVRIYLEKEISPKKAERTLYQKYPFLKFAGKFDDGVKITRKDLDNEEIDKAVYNL